MNIYWEMKVNFILGSSAADHTLCFKIPFQTKRALTCECGLNDSGSIVHTLHSKMFMPSLEYDLSQTLPQMADPHTSDLQSGG